MAILSEIFPSHSALFWVGTLFLMTETTHTTRPVLHFPGLHTIPIRLRNLQVRESYSNGRPDLPLVIFVGRMSPEKQVDKIADLVKEANPPGRGC